MTQRVTMQVHHGQRVRHTTWTDDAMQPLVGTVEVFEPGAAGAVWWDGYKAGNTLASVADHLEPA